MRHLTILAAALAATVLAGCSSRVPTHSTSDQVAPAQAALEPADNTAKQHDAAAIAEAAAAFGPGVDATVTRGFVVGRLVRRGVAVLLVVTKRHGVATAHYITAPAATAPPSFSEVAVLEGPEHSALVVTLPSH